MDPEADLVREPPLNGNTAGDGSEVSPLTILKDNSSFRLLLFSRVDRERNLRRSRKVCGCYPFQK